MRHLIDRVALLDQLQLDLPIARTDARSAPMGVLPTFDHELTLAQAQAVRTTCLIAGPILISFSALDAAVVPAQWDLLLALRLAAAAAFALLAALLTRRLLSPMPALAIVVALVTIPIEVGAMYSGAAESPYIYAAMLPMGGAALLVPLRPLQAAGMCALVLGLVYIPIVAWPGPTDAEAVATGASFLVCMAVLTIVGSAIHQRVFRREFEARHLAARQVGLANLGMLAAGLAHELSNPLAVMALGVERLKRGADATQRLGGEVERLAQAVDRMREVLDAMRAKTKAAGREFAPVNLAHEIEQAVVLLDERCARAAIDLQQDVGQIPPVHAERTLLGQVLMNLLVNAVHAVEGRAPPRWIAIRLHSDEGRAVVEVEDNGPGVPAEMRARIFEPLFTTKGESGTGLGLWLSAEIARAHGGALTVHDGSEGGALFRLTLPQATGD